MTGTRPILYSGSCNYLKTTTTTVLAYMYTKYFESVYWNNIPEVPACRDTTHRTSCAEPVHLISACGNAFALVISVYRCHRRLESGDAIFNQRGVFTNSKARIGTRKFVTYMNVVIAPTVIEYILRDVAVNTCQICIREGVAPSGHHDAQDTNS